MTRFELSISPNYVPDWTPVDAIREIFQNALDQQTENPENPMSWEYSPEDRTLIISSKLSKLSTSSLLFGEGDKADKADLIGAFGEGYKLALLVLTRLDKPVTIQNYGQKELWTPSIEYSPKYGKKILIIRTKRHIFKAPPDNDLTFILEEIDPVLYAAVARSNLHILPPDKTISTPFGRVLLDDRQTGRIYVNGLFVCTDKDFRYGYDIHPKYLKLGRDRKLVSSFDLKWITSHIWAKINDLDLISTIIEQGMPDVAYIVTANYQTSRIYFHMRTDFISRYGHRAIPVSSQKERDDIRQTCPGLRPIFVKPGHREILSHYYRELIEKSGRFHKAKSPNEILTNFLESYGVQLDTEAVSALRQIVTNSEQWVWED